MAPRVDSPPEQAYSRGEQVGEPDEIALPATESHPRQRVLVVDDNEVNRDLLRIRLERERYQVDEAENGELALATLRQGSFDLVLLDVMMPVLDGIETLLAIKTDASLRDIPVIMVSAVSELDTVARCLEQGADDYLTKPFNPVFLKSRVRGSLERRRLRELERRMTAGDGEE
jgi:DNA-binding response OmpR family regulator